MDISFYYYLDRVGEGCIKWSYSEGEEQIHYLVHMWYEKKVKQNGCYLTNIILDFEYKIKSTTA